LIFDLIEALRGATPLLLISQRPLPIGDLHIDLAGLQPDTIEQIWRDAGYPLDAVQAQRLGAYTGGNPRLLVLLLSLQQQAEAEFSTDELDDETARSLQPAFQRLWRRLQPEEQRALQQLSVYQGYAPEELLEPAILAALSRLKLIDHDQSGGVALLPALAPVIRNDLPDALRVRLHNAAAVMRLERGEYTAAAYHFVESGDPDRAVQIWFPQRQHALARGEADSARPIFLPIERTALAPAERKAFDIIRAELRHYAGELTTSLEALKQSAGDDVSEASARLWMFRGELEDALGYPDQALKSYGEGLRVTARLVGQITALYQRSGLLHLRRRDLQSSWQAVDRAEFELEVLRGKLRDEEGDYAGALAAYTQARSLADKLEDDALRAQAERWLATIYGRREQLVEAVQHATRAISIYERIGDRLNLEQMRSNLASIYVQTREFQAALEVGVSAYAFFLAIHDQLYASGTAANLAEASYNLGDLDGAARYASEVLAMNQPFTMPYARFTLGQVELCRAHIVAAASHFSAAMEQARRNEDHYMAVYAQRALGEAHLRAGDLRTADEQLRQALAAFRALEIPSEIAATEELLANLEAAQLQP
jgi:tetratricopeptide (TPR) repeat protein